MENDIRLLVAASTDHDQDNSMIKNQDQMITILITMLPDQAAECLVEQNTVGSSTLEEMESMLSD